MPESSFYHISPKGTLASVATFGRSPCRRQERGICLAGLPPADEGTAKRPNRLLGLHPLSIKKLSRQESSSQDRGFSGNTFVIFNAFSYTNRKLSVDEVELFIGEKFLITVSGYDSGDVGLCTTSSA